MLKKSSPGLLNLFFLHFSLASWIHERNEVSNLIIIVVIFLAKSEPKIIGGTNSLV